MSEWRGRQNVVTLRSRTTYWTENFDSFFYEIFLEQNYGFRTYVDLLPDGMAERGIRCWGCSRRLISRAVSCTGCFPAYKEFIYQLYAAALDDYHLMPGYGIDKPENYMGKGLSLIEQYYLERWEKAEKWRDYFHREHPHSDMPDYLVFDENGKARYHWYRMDSHWLRKLEAKPVKEIPKNVKIVAVMDLIVTEDGTWKLVNKPTSCATTGNIGKVVTAREEKKDINTVMEKSAVAALEKRKVSATAPEKKSKLSVGKVNSDLHGVQTPGRVVNRQPDKEIEDILMLSKRWYPPILGRRRKGSRSATLEMEKGWVPRGSLAWKQRISFVLKGSLFEPG